MSSGAKRLINVVAPGIIFHQSYTELNYQYCVRRRAPRAGGYIKRVSHLGPHNTDHACGSLNYSFGNSAQRESLHTATSGQAKHQITGLIGKTILRRIPVLFLDGHRRGASLYDLDASAILRFLGRRRLMSTFENRLQSEKGKLVRECKKGIVGLQHVRPVRNKTLTLSSDQEYKSALW